MKPLKNILETARELGATDFVQYVEESGLQKEWAREGVFTPFFFFFLFFQFAFCVSVDYLSLTLTTRHLRCSLRPTKPSPTYRGNCAPESTPSAATSKIRSFVTTSPIAKWRPILSRPIRLYRRFTTAIACVSTNIPAAWVNHASHRKQPLQILPFTIQSQFKPRTVV